MLSLFFQSSTILAHSITNFVSHKERRALEFQMKILALKNPKSCSSFILFLKGFSNFGYDLGGKELNIAGDFIKRQATNIHLRQKTSMTE